MRRRITTVLLSALTVAGLLAPAPPAGAAPSPSTTSTTAPARDRRATSPKKSPTRSSTATPTTPTTPVEAPPAPPAPGDDALVAGDSAPEPVPDPVEVPPPAPEALAPVPSIDTAAVQRVVAERLRLARERAVEAEAARAAAALVVDDLRARLAALDADIAALQEQERAALARLAEARARIVDRAAVAYVHGSLSRVETVIDARDANDFLRRVHAVRSVLDADNRAIADLRSATAAAGADVRRLLGDREQLAGDLADAEVELERRTAEAAIAGAGMSSLETGGVAIVNVGGLVFPIAGSASFTDTFGAPRMPGTAYAHRHQGTDVFAAAGTPLVAVERGVISRMGTDLLGGIKLWLQGASGARYYYAHLSAYAEGLHQGQVVEAGAPVGYVGNTGNARTTPPHLHFEVHPGGGPAANPYPLLRAVQDATVAAREAAAAAPGGPVPPAPAG